MNVTKPYSINVAIASCYECLYSGIGMEQIQTDMQVGKCTEVTLIKSEQAYKV